MECSCHSVPHLQGSSFAFESLHVWLSQDRGRGLGMVEQLFRTWEPGRGAGGWAPGRVSFSWTLTGASPAATRAGPLKAPVFLVSQSHAVPGCSGPVPSPREVARRLQPVAQPEAPELAPPPVPTGPVQGRVSPSCAADPAASKTLSKGHGSHVTRFLQRPGHAPGCGGDPSSSLFSQFCSQRWWP